MYYTNNGTDLYQGDMQLGDREATQEEINAYLSTFEQVKIKQEAQTYLDNTDYKFTSDYDNKDTVEWLEIKQKRAEVREIIRNY